MWCCLRLGIALTPEVREDLTDPLAGDLDLLGDVLLDETFFVQCNNSVASKLSGLLVLLVWRHVCLRLGSTEYTLDQPSRQCKYLSENKFQQGACNTDLTMFR